jgi:hypothetical protein
LGAVNALIHPQFTVSKKSGTKQRQQVYQPYDETQGTSNDRCPEMELSSVGGFR